ncbi:hypothetical protein E3P89_04052 [Wallemia ichthyophaga]|uniref:Exosome complex protein n=1 Tax=Wallemia ichthyophaga TaxID=245174 RepID=A0A4T0GWI8_WALIC|nr:hypothetical protein E3P93_04061 [Wallemia ichthyophaga]TIB07494.1 hypothetical protein E3P90_04058 [Wallemia ichthyophaga]TIB19348.1 hypothetical protein E3P89_04052 [Wallemia ichthyophaga]TIB20060.1 hypothetical protein E3P88_04063 [Wallemia ichthyophaga]
MSDKSLDEYLGELDTIKQSELQANLAYFIQDLVYILLNLKGVDTTDHSIANELNRIKLQFSKIKHAQEPQHKLNVDKPAADRFIKAALQLQQKSTEQPQQSQHLRFDNDHSEKKTSNDRKFRSDKKSKKRSSDSHQEKPPSSNSSTSLNTSQPPKSKKSKKHT